MKEIIKITTNTIGSDLVETVNARDLHNFLEVATRYNDWFSSRVKDFGFAENTDFLTLTENLVSGGKQNVHFLTLDMAKELSMVERNERGKEARKYFIECEKQLRQPPQLNDPGFLRDTLLTYTERVIALESELEEAKPQIKALERIEKADGSLCVTDAAKALQVRPKDLFSYLRNHGWVYRRAGAAHDVGYQSRVLSGLLEHKVTTVLRPDGSERITEQVRVTPKGLTKLAQLIPMAVAAA